MEYDSSRINESSGCKTMYSHPLLVVFRVVIDLDSSMDVYAVNIKIPEPMSKSHAMQY